jgi:hypothetical protein
LANDQSVAHQIVATHAVELDKVLDPDRLGQSGAGEEGEGQKEADHLRYSVRLRRETRAVTR